MIFAGTIRDSKTGQGVPFASVRIFLPDGRYTGTAVSADANGNFKVSGDAVGYPNIAEITSSEYEATRWEMDYDDFTGAVVTLVRKVKELPPVVVTSGSKDNYAWLALLAIPMLATTRQKKVGEIGFNTPTIITAGAAFLLFKGAGLINSLLSALGLGKDKDDKDIDAENSNPDSPLKPTLYLSATTAQRTGVYATLTYGGKATDLGQKLLNSFGAFNDDEATAISVFKSFTTQLQASCFAYIWEKEWNFGDLLQWLRGDAYPNDRLDTGEINEILRYLKNLPKY